MNVVIGNCHVSKNRKEDEESEKEKKIKDGTEGENGSGEQSKNGTVDELEHTADRTNSKKQTTWADVVKRAK